MHTARAMPPVAWHPQARMGYEPHVAIQRLPKERLSGRPSCRIYPTRQTWVLELEPSLGSWTQPPTRSDRFESARLTFSTLAAAIGYAMRHGLVFRVVGVETPGHGTARNSRARRPLPRSWTARLARNGRNGEMYHG